MSPAGRRGGTDVATSSLSPVPEASPSGPRRATSALGRPAASHSERRAPASLPRSPALPPAALPLPAEPRRRHQARGSLGPWGPARPGRGPAQGLVARFRARPPCGPATRPHGLLGGRSRRPPAECGARGASGERGPGRPRRACACVAPWWPPRHGATAGSGGGAAWGRRGEGEDG